MFFSNHKYDCFILQLYFTEFRMRVHFSNLAEKKQNIHKWMLVSLIADHASMLPYNLVPRNSDAIPCLWSWCGLFPSPQRQLLLSLEVSALEQGPTGSPTLLPIRGEVFSLCISSALHTSLSLYTLSLPIHISDFPLESKSPRRTVSYLYLHLKHLPQFLVHSKNSIPTNIFVGLILGILKWNVKFNGLWKLMKLNWLCYLIKLASPFSENASLLRVPF